LTEQTEEELVRQVNVELPKDVFVALNKHKTRIYEETAKKISYKDIIVPALRIWFPLNNVGFFEAIGQAKKERAKEILDKAFQTLQELVLEDEH
jgi:hypothetical protein